MESGTDLFRLADAENQQETANSPTGRISGFLQQILTGANKGLEQGTAAAIASQNRAVSQAHQIADTAKKLQDMKIEAENQRISTNMMKRTGLIPLDPGEADAARGAALDGIADKNPPASPTSAGRIATLMIGGDEYGPVPEFSSKNGMTIKYEKSTAKKDARDAADKREADIQAKAYTMAAEAARRDKFNQVSTLSTDPDVVQKYGNVQPTEDEIQKYVPEMVSYLRKDPKSSVAARNSRSAHQGFVDEALKETQAQLDDLSSRSPIRNALTPGDQGAQIQDLTNKRNALLSGGGTPIVRQMYGQEIKTLAAKRAAGKATPEDNARLKTLTSRLLKIGDLGGK